MHVLRLTVAAAIAAAAAATLPATAAAEHALGGTTTITAARSGSLDVVMNEDAVIRLQPDGTTRDVALRGPGRMVAFSMVFQGNAGDELTAVRTTFAGKQHTDTATWGTYYPQSRSCGAAEPPSVPGVYEGCTPTNTPPKYVVLHQGRYHVRVLTDGGPLTVTLQLHGLRGSSSLRTSKPLASSVAPIDKLDVIADRYARAQAPVTAATASDLIYRVDASEASGARLHSASECLYDTPTTMPTDYAPGCPAGTGGGFSWLDTSETAHSGYVGLGGWGSVAPGTYRFGLGIGAETGVSYRGGWVALLQAET